MDTPESQVEVLAGVREGSAGAIARAGAPRFLGEIALHDWRLAGALLHAAKRGQGYRLAGNGALLTDIGVRGWQIVNIKGRFDTTAADRQIEAQTLGIVETELWIRRVAYTVRRPQYAAGSIWKAQSDYFNKLNPNIDVNSFIINSFCRYIIADEPTPLENIEAVFECVCPAGIVLSCSANIEAFFTILRTLQADEVPTEVIISLHGTRLPGGIYQGCEYADVIAALRAEGVFTPRDPGPVCP